MEPLRSNQNAMQVDMATSTGAAQALKKLKPPKFVPYEPAKAAVGPLVREQISSNPKNSAPAQTISSTSLRLPTQILHRYPKTILQSRPTNHDDSAYSKNTSNALKRRPIEAKENIVMASSQEVSETKVTKPVNIVDPIRAVKGACTVTFADELHEDAADMEPYSDTRAVAHLQAVNEACNQKIVQLRDERSELKKELELQFQINAELKKLLVASMGDEMHHDVEMLVRQRAQLSAEIEAYCRKFHESQESLDKMNIMADMWRSKYIASRVMFDELAGWKATVSVRHDEARHALQTLLNERHVIRNNMSEATRYLQQIHSTLYNNSGRLLRVTKLNLVELSKLSLFLAETLKFKFVGELPVTVDAIATDDPTPAEELALEVISHSGHINAPSSFGGRRCTHGSCAARRFNPDARYEFITLNCCKHCKGDISVV